MCVFIAIDSLARSYVRVFVQLTLLTELFCGEHDVLACRLFVARVNIIIITIMITTTIVRLLK